MRKGLSEGPQNNHTKFILRLEITKVVQKDQKSNNFSPVSCFYSKSFMNTKNKHIFRELLLNYSPKKDCEVAKTK